MAPPKETGKSWESASYECQPKSAVVADDKLTRLNIQSAPRAHGSKTCRCQHKHLALWVGCFFHVWVGLLGHLGFCIGSVGGRGGMAEVYSALIIPSMRINLVTPFAEKEAVKALGARWDAAKKLWYIVDVADLTPFARWIPNMDAAKDGSDNGPQANPRISLPKPTNAAAQSKSADDKADCGCDVLPWEDCVHTAKP